MVSFYLKYPKRAIVSELCLLSDLFLGSQSIHFKSFSLIYTLMFFFVCVYFQKKQVHQLSVLISLLLGELTKSDRQKIMTICTIDVHSRDVVLKLIQSRLESASAFQWQSQLRHRWDDDENDCFANICDAQFRYCYEYLGNTPRLVITPLSMYCNAVNER